MQKKHHKIQQWEKYLVIYDHKLGVDVDLEAPVLLGILIGTACRRVRLWAILTLLICLSVTCINNQPSAHHNVVT